MSSSLTKVRLTLEEACAGRGSDPALAPSHRPGSVGPCCPGWPSLHFQTLPQALTPFHRWGKVRQQSPAGLWELL